MPQSPKPTTRQPLCNTCAAGLLLGGELPKLVTAGVHLRSCEVCTTQRAVPCNVYAAHEVCMASVDVSEISEDYSYGLEVLHDLNSKVIHLTTVPRDTVSIWLDHDIFCSVSDNPKPLDAFAKI